MTSFDGRVQIRPFVYLLRTLEPDDRRHGRRLYMEAR